MLKAGIVLYKPMTPEDRVLFLLSQPNPSEAHHHEVTAICQSHALNWKTILETADYNGVSPLVYSNLEGMLIDGLAIPPEILRSFKVAYLRNVAVKKNSHAMLKRIQEFARQRGLNVMLVKGAALDLVVYEKPWYLIAKDIDLVFSRREEDVPCTTREEITEFIEFFNRQLSQYKQHVEYDYYVHHDVTMNGVLPIDAGRVWQEAEKVQNKDLELWVMSPEDMLLAAAINCCRKRFFKLKSLVDIAAILGRFPNLDWQVLVEKARAYQCNTILFTALTVTQMTIGCQMPERGLLPLGIHPVRAGVVRLLVRGLLKASSFAGLSKNVEGKLLGRELSWGLILTYTTYRLDQIQPKLAETLRAWREGSAPAQQSG